MEAASTSNNGQSTTSYEIRISSQTKIQACVRFALDKLEENEDMTLVFHTFPLKKPEDTAFVDAAQANEAAEAGPSEPKTSSYWHTTKNSPKLLSIVEITKREHLKRLAKNRSPCLSGLHQYNETGCLEDLGYPAAAGEVEDRATEIAKALSGKNHVSQHQTPYLKITLSLKEIPELELAGATHQTPAVRKLSKSAQARRKRREKKAAESGDGNASIATTAPLALSSSTAP